MMDLSIIIPVYNTDVNKMNRCLDSILEISNDISYELIIVNDGSNYELVIQYEKMITSKKQKNIKIVNQKNQGVSEARNVGMNIANGKYIMFVDSDDEINGDVLKKEYFNQEFDLIIFDISLITKHNKIIKSKMHCNQGIIRDNHILINELIYNGIFGGPCAKLYKKDFLMKNNLKFDNTLIEGEDKKFNLDFFKRCPYSYYIKENLYNYYFLNTSLNGRWKKSGDLMVNNFISNYNEEKKAIDDCNKLNILKENTLKNIFLECMIIVELKLSNKKELLNKLNCFAMDIDIDYQNLSLIDKIKYKVVIKKRWKTIKMLNIIRKIYLNFFK